MIAEVDGAEKKSFHQIFAAERAIIQIQVEWEQFVRALVLDSATGRFTNASGRIFSRRFPDSRSREAVAYRLISLYPKQRLEPDWYLPAKAIDAALRLDVSNGPHIAAELGITPWPIEELRHLRNFIAHQSKRSAIGLRGTGVVGVSRRIDALEIACGYGGSGAKRYEEWIDFTSRAAERLVA